MAAEKHKKFNTKHMIAVLNTLTIYRSPLLIIVPDWIFYNAVIYI